ncbi:hypothetical protein V6N12_009961 [Hibiscus sabdariffa]|uniref:Uncharacterized protein n=1 Tax=Hibiscus sabdariffa TaxID=183260 RepID=A0ABR2ECA4_9ROSI
MAKSVPMAMSKVMPRKCRTFGIADKRHNVPKISSNKALLVKGRMISPATWRNLTGAEAKEKGKGKMNEPTPKSEATKTMPAPTPLPEESSPAKSMPAEEHGRATIVKYMISMARNQEAIFKKI